MKAKIHVTLKQGILDPQPVLPWEGRKSGVNVEGNKVGRSR